MKSFKVAGISAFLFLAVPAQALPVYLTADFSGGITNAPGSGDDLGLERTEGCANCPGGSISGHVLFDSSLVPGGPGGIASIPLASIADVPDELVFSISLGSHPLEFHFGDAGINGAPAIQFNNGVFDGFNFSETFLHGGNSFRFAINGSAWDIKAANSNGIYSRLAASGFLNVGTNGLFNQENFAAVTPPAENPSQVPEPATLPLLALGLAALALLARGAGRKAVFPV